jgi:hypothetical protein
LAGEIFMHVLGDNPSSTGVLNIVAIRPTSKNHAVVNMRVSNIPAQPPPSLDDVVAKVRGLLASGQRATAIDESRRAVALYPRSAQVLRILSHSLTYAHLYRNDEDLTRKLHVEGAFVQALGCSRAAMRLPDSNYEDFLQAGYCLTALGEVEEAKALIRTATNMHSVAEHPALFAGLNDAWMPLVPRFLIIGAAKAGTTSLYNQICKHPRILPAIVKEIPYFSTQSRGKEWYFAHFPSRPHWEERFCTGEANVANFNSLSGPLLVRETLPNVRLIALVRNPVDRAISHYYNDLNVGTETRSIDDAMEDELSYLDCPEEHLSRNLDEYRQTQRRYLELGLYALHLENWRRHFPPKRLAIVVSEEIHAAPERELRRVFKHIGLKYWPSGEYANDLPGVYDEQPKDRVRARLGEFFARHNERLFEILGRRLDW